MAAADQESVLEELVPAWKASAAGPYLRADAETIEMRYGTCPAGGRGPAWGLGAHCKGLGRAALDSEVAAPDTGRNRSTVDSSHRAVRTAGTFVAAHEEGIRRHSSSAVAAWRLV